MSFLWVVWLGCTGVGSELDTSSWSVTGGTGSTSDTSDRSTRDSTGDSSTGDTAPQCLPKAELGTGEFGFEPMGDELVMINGPQGGWHVLTALRLCDLGDEAVVSFRAVRIRDELEVGGSGLVSLSFAAEDDCCSVAYNVFTYLLVAGAPSPAEALHEEAVRLEVEATLPDGASWTDTVETTFIDPTR